MNRVAQKWLRRQGLATCWKGSSGGLGHGTSLSRPQVDGSVTPGVTPGGPTRLTQFSTSAK